MAVVRWERNLRIREDLQMRVINTKKLNVIMCEQDYGNGDSNYWNLLGFVYWNRKNHFTFKIFFGVWEIIIDLTKQHYVGYGDG